MVNFTCDQCGRKYIYRRNLDQHVRRNHTALPVFDCDQCERSFARSSNLEKHKRTCTGDRVVVVPVAAPAAKRRCIGVAPEFKLRKTRKSLGGAIEHFTVNMKEAKNLSALEKAIAVCTPVMMKFQQEHRAYKFQISVSVVSHKADDPAVITQPPVVLTSEMVAVSADAAPPLDDVNRRLLNFIEVYKHNGSGWVFSNFTSLQLTLGHLDPLRASAFLPLPRWIQAKRAVVNGIGTGDDCFKWAVLAGMHPVNDNAHRMDKYVEHVNKYDFPSLRFPVPLSSIASFAKANNLSINVYGIEDDKKVIYPLCVSQAVVPGRYVDLLLYERNSTRHYTNIKNFRRLVSSQLGNHNGATYCYKKCLHGYLTRKLFDAHAGCCHAQRTKFAKDPRCRFTNIQK